jgi:hypothetical protein
MPVGARKPACISDHGKYRGESMDAYEIRHCPVLYIVYMLVLFKSPDRRAVVHDWCDTRKEELFKRFKTKVFKVMDFVDKGS